MSGHVQKVDVKATQLRQCLRASGSAVDVVTLFEHFAFKLASFIVFSEDADDSHTTSQDALRSYKALRDSQTMLGTFGHVPWLYSVNAKFPFLIPQNSKFTEFAKQLIERRKKVAALVFP